MKVLPEPTYGEAEARAILKIAVDGILDQETLWVDAAGVWTSDDFNAWHPYLEIADLPDSPNPATEPSLPFPFTASQLAAFALSGWGRFIAEGFFGDGPFEATGEGPLGNDVKYRDETLSRFPARATKAREAVLAAYTAYERALANVPPFDSARMGVERAAGRVTGPGVEAVVAPWRRAMCRDLLQVRIGPVSTKQRGITPRASAERNPDAQSPVVPKPARRAQRRNDLTDAIEQAIIKSGPSPSPLPVYRAILEFAENRDHGLVGVVDGEVEYTVGDRTAKISRELLLKRIRNALNQPCDDH